jgi:hypothetical protein
VVVRKFLSSGLADTGYGVEGSSTVAFGAGTVEAVAGAVASDGAAMFHVSYFNAGQYRRDLIRFTADGAPDSDLGASGVVQVASPTFSFMEASSAAYSPADEFLFATRYSLSGSVQRRAVDGAADPTWSAALPNGFTANDFSFDPQRNVVVAGGSGELAALRRSSSGAEDQTFGLQHPFWEMWVATVPVPDASDSEAHAVVATSDRVYLWGDMAPSSGDFELGAVLAAMDSVGNVVEDFGNGDGLTKPLREPLTASETTGVELILDGSSHLTALGRSLVGTTGYIYLTRFDMDGVPDSEFGSNATGVSSVQTGTVDQPQPISLDRTEDGRLLVVVQVGQAIRLYRFW